MKRRELLKTIPLSFAGSLAMPWIVSAAENPTSYWKQYRDIVCDKLTKIHLSESDAMLETAHRMAHTIRSGKTCWSQWDLGHSFHEDIFPDRHGDPGVMTAGYDEDKAEKGDLLLISLLLNAMEDPREKGIFVTGAQGPWCADTPDAEKLLSKKHKSLRVKPYSDIWINNGLSTLGPEVWLPGAQYPMGALSGILGMVTFWMMQADAVRILASEGISVNVKGDEPEFDTHSNYVSLTEPLGDRYFEEVTSQMGRIESEMGTVHKIADTAVETILNGGKVHVYSKFWEALSIEANTRRGGLTCFHSVDSNMHKEYSGDDKDFVIMGIYSPDDPVDVDYLNTFKKAGSKVASIGPAERNKKYPDNSIPQQTDFHLGYMCDTYGIFAVPGVKRKICPTSGALVNQMFYAVCFRMAEQFIKLTGNSPYIYPNGATEGPPYAEFSRIHTAGLARGY